MSNKGELDAVLDVLGRVLLAVLACAILASLLHPAYRNGTQVASARRISPRRSPARASTRAPLRLRLWRAIRAAGIVTLLRAAYLVARTLAFCRLTFLPWAE